MFYFWLGLTEKNLWFVPVQHPSVTDFSGHINWTSYFCSVFPPITILNNQNRFPPRTKSLKIVYFAKTQPISKPIFKQKGAIGKPERPKKHPIWAADPRAHLSTKYPPPPRFTRSFVSSERVLGLPSLIDSSKVSITIMFTLYNIPWSYYKWAIIVSDSLAWPNDIIAKSSIKTGYSISGKHPSPFFWRGGYLVFIVCQKLKIGNFEKGYIRHFFNVFITKLSFLI